MRTQLVLFLSILTILSFSVSCGDDDDSSTPLSSKFDGEFLSEKCSEATNVIKGVTLYELEGVAISDSIITLTDILYSDKDCLNPAMYATSEIKASVEEEYKGITVVKGKYTALTVRFVDQSMIDKANTTKFSGKDDWQLDETYALDKRALRQINKEPEYTAIKLVGNKLYGGSYFKDRKDESRFGEDWDEYIKVGTEKYNGSYVSECTQGAEEHTSFIADVSITDSQVTFIRTFYTYDGETPTCNEVNKQNKVKVVFNYTKADRAHNGYLINLNVTSYIETPLSEAIKNSYNESSRGGAIDWEVGVDKDLTSILSVRTELHRWRLDGFTLYESTLDPESGSLISLLALTKSR